MSGTTWTCDITRDGGTSAGTLNVVHNGSSACTGGSTKYCAWGTASDTGDFCCEISGTPNSILAVGGPGADWIQFKADAVPPHSLSNDGAGHTLQAEATGGPGNDFVRGSHSTSSAYSETLKGGSGADEIDAHEGGDVCWGDDGDDFMAGGEGNDWMDGGPGDDTMIGEEGNDEMRGYTGNDEMNGDAGEDEMNGDGGVDVVCGGDDDDSDLDGGPDNGDIVVGGAGTDTVDGGFGTNDECEGDFAAGGCEYTTVTCSYTCP